MIAEAIAHVDPARVLGVHTNFPMAQAPLTLASAMKVELFDGELDRARFRSASDIGRLLDITGYMLLQSTRPETIGEHRCPVTPPQINSSLCCHPHPPRRTRCCTIRH